MKNIYCFLSLHLAQLSATKAEISDHSFPVENGRFKNTQNHPIFQYPTSAFADEIHCYVKVFKC